MNETVDKLKKLLGSNCITDPSLTEAYVSDWRGLQKGRAACVLRPSSAELLAKCMVICRDAGISVVPQGGNTGLVGGSTPDDSGVQIVVSTSAMKAVRKIDPVDMSLIAEAGVTIAELQTVAEEAGALFPLSFASEGTATLGGALATNAGGISAVRYGSARDLLLGMEVVLPDGRIWNGLRTLRKDNVGYALKHIFAGSEGTLGIITAAAMKLYPAPRVREVAFCSVDSEDHVVDLWMKLRDAGEGNVRAAEYISAPCIELAAREAGLRCPVAKANHYVLIELASSRPDAKLSEFLESFLGERLEDGTILDAALAQSGDQQKHFWRLREDQTEVQKKAGYDFKHDVAVPIAQVAELLRRCRTDIEARFPEANLVPFGHIGDGNIHMNVVFPKIPGDEKAVASSKQASQIIYDIVLSLGGTFSAEHGIGSAKVALLEDNRSSIEIDLMRQIKFALDRGTLMNPDRIFRQIVDANRPQQ